MSGSRTPEGCSRRAWGWHRLADSWARRVVAQSGVREGDLVVDFGAGLGALVRPLLAAGARVLAVELHPDRAQALRERWTDEIAARRLTVVQIDALRFPLPTHTFRVVASPPYAITSPLLSLLVARRSRLHTAHLVLPRQVATRWASGQASGAGRWSRCFTLELAMPVPRKAFVPPPRVDSVLLVIRRRSP